jgi:hypothetical protein
MGAFFVLFFASQSGVAETLSDVQAAHVPCAKPDSVFPCVDDATIDGCVPGCAIDSIPGNDSILDIPPDSQTVSFYPLYAGRLGSGPDPYPPKFL